MTCGENRERMRIDANGRELMKNNKKKSMKEIGYITGRTTRTKEHSVLLLVKVKTTHSTQHCNTANSTAHNTADNASNTTQYNTIQHNTALHCSAHLSELALRGCLD
jgi:hypothetical protein